ncbi:MULTISPECIES: hypothetical protein [Oscillatoriales]|nr:MULTISPECIES: hypothetical protein [Oscillatoriales]
MPIPSEIQDLIDRLNQELAETETDATQGLNLVRPILSQFPDNARMIHAMKQLPDDETLDKLLELAKDFENKAKAVYDLATEIDEKLRLRQEARRQAAIEELRKAKSKV